MQLKPFETKLGPQFDTSDANIPESLGVLSFFDELRGGSTTREGEEDLLEVLFLSFSLISVTVSFFLLSLIGSVKRPNI